MTAQLSPNHTSMITTVPSAIEVSERNDGLTMVVSPAEALKRVQELQAFVAKVMVSGIDYGTIPGTDKPSLLQPGAQKLEEIYGFAHQFEDIEQIARWEDGFFLFRKRCVLTRRRDGRYVGDGVGSCNSRESRYAYRWVFDGEIPAGVDRKTLKSETKPSRKTGKPYTRFRLPNEDIFSLVNTLEKMACKRALVHAVIGATRSSGIFTQDVEDLPAEVLGRASTSRSWESPPDVGDAEKPAEDADKTALAFKARFAELAKGGTLEEWKAISAEIGKANLPEAFRIVLRDVAAVAKARIVERQKASVEPDRHPDTGELVPDDVGA